MTKWVPVLALFLFVPFFSTSAQTSLAPNASAIVRAVNVERESRGLSPLKINSNLTLAAEDRSRVLAKQGVLIHTSAPVGEAWPTLQSAGYVYKSAGENLASIPPSSIAVVPAWMNSAPHKANILASNYTEIGIGIAVGPYKGGVAYYIVGYFAEPKEAVKGISISNTEKNEIISEKKLISEINTETTKLSKATTKEQKIPIIIRLINLLKSYLDLIES
ncbi:MAG: CAP domain-containing protein [bacterium]|nr:CAP domain-containing protein [bacterium]